jgi:hypothetical protein
MLDLTGRGCLAENGEGFVGFCKHNNEPASPTKDRKFLGDLSDYQPLKKAAAT